MGYGRVLYRLWLIRTGRFYSSQSSSGQQSNGQRADSKSSSSTESKLFSSSSNYYEVLGVNKNCSQKDVREAYISRTKEYHPDSDNKLGLSKEQLKAKFQQVNEAYSVLNNVDSRKSYDLGLTTGRIVSHWDRRPAEHYRGFYHRDFDPFWNERKNYYEEQQRKFRDQNPYDQLIYGFLLFLVCAQVATMLIRFSAIRKSGYGREATPYEQMMADKDFELMMRRRNDEASYFTDYPLNHDRRPQVNK